MPSRCLPNAPSPVALSRPGGGVIHQLLSAQRTIRCLPGPGALGTCLWHLHGSYRPHSSEGFSCGRGPRHVVHVHINMETVLRLLGLGHSLEGQARPSRRIDEGPRVVSMHWFATEDGGPEIRKCGWVLAIHYDLINASNHFLSLPLSWNLHVRDGDPAPFHCSSVSRFNSGMPPVWSLRESLPSDAPWIAELRAQAVGPDLERLEGPAGIGPSTTGVMSSAGAGVLSCMLNPKVGLFFLAVVPQFVPEGGSVFPLTMLLGARTAVANPRN